MIRMTIGIGTIINLVPNSAIKYYLMAEYLGGNSYVYNRIFTVATDNHVKFWKL